MRHIWMSIALFGMTALLGAVAAAGQPPEEPIPPFVKTVDLHPGLPPLEIRIIPAAEDSPAAVGRVEISRRGEPKPFQTIMVPVKGGGPIRLTFSEFKDVNFDGYTDLLLGNDGGAKWEGYDVYFYDPRSGTFIQNGLSREMSKTFMANYLQLHRATEEIEMDYLVFGCQERPVTDIYVIEGDHLRRIRQEDLVAGEDGCYKVTRQVLPGGAMTEVSRERAPEYDQE